jgi:phosphoribosylformylglycinamidine cyclo-ligase
LKPAHVDLAASCVGIVQPQDRLMLGERLVAGDAIVLLASSGIHANGVSLARALAERLPQGYATHIGDGRSFGEALLDPTTLYAPVLERVWSLGIRPHYAVNITGHGWRKLMRHVGSFTYRLTSIPPALPVLTFLAREAGLREREAYGSLNMGAGFALFVPAGEAQETVRAARSVGVQAWISGAVEEGPRRVLIEPLALTYESRELELRG